MARDYRHGVGNKHTYQRRSQKPLPEVASTVEEQSLPDATLSTPDSSKRLGMLAVGLSLALISGFFVINHFSVQGIQGEKQKLAIADQQIEPEPMAVLLPDANPIETDSIEEKSQENGGGQGELDTEVASSMSGQPSVIERAAALPDRLEQPLEDTQQQTIHFTFYEGLAQTEVVVDVEPISVTLDYYHYVLAGTFYTQQQAQVEQARLQAKGFAVKVNVLDTQLRRYFRVRLGPFSDRLEMNEQRNALRAAGVETLLIRSKEKVPTESNDSVEQPTVNAN